MLMDKVNLFFPEKSIRLSDNDKPWVDSQLLKLDRKCKREYNKNKKSEKWTNLHQEFLDRAENLKEWYNVNMVEDLKTSNIGQWYSKVKRMSSIDPTREEKVIVQDIMDYSSQEQADVIADRFSEISNLYEPLNSDDVEVPSLEDSKPLPLFKPFEIYEKIKKMKKKASTVFGDIPWKVITKFSVELSFPLSNVYNSSTLAGTWPSIWKHEFVTPVPKVFPPGSTNELRKISGTKNLSKIYEALLSDCMISDMSQNIDPSQFGNEKGLGIQHFLVKMINQILTILDSNNDEEKAAVIASLVDWSKAFDRMNHKLGVDSFISNG